MAEVLQGQGIFFPGHLESPSEAVGKARDWLLGHGVSSWLVGEVEGRMAPQLAWMDTTFHHFVQEGHSGSQPVTVVHFPDLVADGSTP